MELSEVETKVMAKKRKGIRTVGLVELVTIIGKKGRITKKALLDTGATRTSVDIMIAAKVGIGPIISSVKIKNASTGAGFTRRPVAEAKIKIKGVIIKTGVNVVDRSDLPYPILIGRDVIHKNFVVDISKTHTSHHVKDLKQKE